MKDRRIAEGQEAEKPGRRKRRAKGTDKEEEEERKRDMQDNRPSQEKERIPRRSLLCPSGPRLRRYEQRRNQ